MSLAPGPHLRSNSAVPPPPRTCRPAAGRAEQGSNADSNAPEKVICNGGASTDENPVIPGVSDLPGITVNHSCGAGENRTPVREAVAWRDTTVPVLRSQRLPRPRVGGPHEEGTAGSFPEVSGLSRRQRSLPAVHHRFCCRAAVIWPRAPLPVTMTLIPPDGSGGESELLVGGSFGCPV